MIINRDKYFKRLAYVHLFTEAGISDDPSLEIRPDQAGH